MSSGASNEMDGSNDPAYIVRRRVGETRVYWDVGTEMPKLPDLKFKVTNLGSVHNGQFCQKPLTVFCGPNNTGKTWTLYCLYLFYKSLPWTRHERPGEDYFLPSPEYVNDLLSDFLPDFFNSATFLDDGAKFSIIYPHDLEPLRPFAKEGIAFLMPAERNGLHLFFRELSSRRTSLLHRASRRRIGVDDLLRDVIDSPYAQPIADYIDWLNSLWEIQERSNVRTTRPGSNDPAPSLEVPEDISPPTTRGFHHLAEHLKRRLAGGSYRVRPRTGSIEFRAFRSSNGGRSTNPIGLHITSSAVKSLFALWFYLEHQATIGNILMIDEPELNLHPESQRQVARLLARLVNAGVNVAISTHSDYIIREFNNLIMLHQEGGPRFRKRHGYRVDEVLDPKDVGAFYFGNNTIEPFELTDDAGIHATTFDDVIRDLNSVSREVYFGLRQGGRAASNG